MNYLFEIKGYTLCVSVLMFVVCLNIERLVILLSLGCDINFVLNIVLQIFTPGLVMIYKFLSNMVRDKEPKKLVRSILFFL